MIHLLKEIKKEVNMALNLHEEIDKHLESIEDTCKDRSYFYISEVGKSKREIYDSFKGKKWKSDAKGKRVFQNGDCVHDRYFKYFAEMGILIAAEIDVVKNDLIHGRLDAIITDKKENYVVEIKSCSQWTFQKLTQPQKEHVLQVLFYMYYSNIRKGFILYECKDNQLIKCFDVELTEKNKEIVEKAIEELKELKKLIDSDIQPENKPILLDDIEYASVEVENDT